MKSKHILFSISLLFCLVSQVLAGTWKQYNCGLKDTRYSSFRIIDDNTWYATSSSTTGSLGIYNYEIELFFTKNAGLSWDSIFVDTGTESVNIQDIKVFNDSTWLMSTSSCMILFTKDKGKTLDTCLKFPYGTIWNIVLADKGFGACTDSHNIYFCSDSGRSWQLATLPARINQRKITEINAVQCFGDSTIIMNCLVNNDSLTNYFGKSTNRGVDWTFTNCIDSVSGDMRFYDEMHGIIGGGYTDKEYTNFKKYAITGDGGITWKEIYYSKGWDYSNDFYFNRNGEIIFTLDNNMCRSENYGDTFNKDSIEFGKYGYEALRHIQSTSTGEYYAMGYYFLYKYDASTSIVENTLSSVNLIYPNPAHSGEKVFIRDFTADIESMSLIDYSGRFISNLDFVQSGNENVISLPNNISTGVYFIQFFANGKHISKKLIIE